MDAAELPNDRSHRQGGILQGASTDAIAKEISEEASLSGLLKATRAPRRARSRHRPGQSPGLLCSRSTRR